MIGDDVEMTRLLEGGTAEVASAVDLGQVPWVTVVPEGAPGGSVSAFATEPVAVLGGRAGREARAVPRGRWPRDVSPSRTMPVRCAARATRLVPRSLAGTGERRASDVRPLVATAALIADSPRRASAARLLARPGEPDGRRALGSCFDPMPRGERGGGARRARPPSTPQSVVDWWMPACSLARNRYNDPNEVLGPPDAVNLGGQDNYLGFMSLGQGGYVTVDMGVTFADRRPGPTSASTRPSPERRAGDPLRVREPRRARSRWSACACPAASARPASSPTTATSTSAPAASPAPAT